MSAIIEKWLMRRLGFATKFTTESIVELSKDGRLIAELLYNYSVITYEQFQAVRPTENTNEALDNLCNHIAIWLKLLGIESTHETMLNIASGKSSAAIRLFYQLYLILQDKDTVHFIKERAKNECLGPSTSKFDVTEVKEPTFNFEVPVHPCEKALLAKRDAIEWHKQRYKLLLEKCSKIREEYIQKLHKQCDAIYSENVKEQKNIQNAERAHDASIVNLTAKVPEDCGYEKLIEEQTYAREAEKLEPQPQKGEEYVQQLKQKRRIKAKEEAEKVQAQKLLLMEMWENLMKEQEQKFENAISEKLLKQSTFEKQMATKLFQVRHQKEVIINNKINADNSIMKQREDDLLDSEFLKEKNETDQRSNYYFERDRVLEMHRRLYEQKLALKAQGHYNMCRDAVKDIVNLALKTYEFQQKHQREVPKRVKYEWGNLFVKEKPIFRTLSTVEDIVQDDLGDLPAEIEEIYSVETDRQNALDDKMFQDYCDYNWPFDIKELGLCDEHDSYVIDAGLNILGHYVHRVLFAKYPKEQPAFPPEVPQVNTAVCIDDISDPSILPTLQMLLQEKGIKLIEMQDAVNYCCEAYKKETTMEYDNALVDETEKALEDLGKKQSKKKKSKSDTGKKGEKKNKKKPTTGTETKSAMDVPTAMNKVCQTPIIFPCEEIVLTDAAYLGKKAYELMSLGEVLPDETTTQIFVEYLKTLRGFKGWVLINYPATFQQTVLLEEYLTGRNVVTDICEESQSIDDLADLSHRKNIYEDKYSALRQSKILPNPHPTVQDNFYETFFTAYISIKQDLPDAETASLQKFNNLEGTNAVEQFYAQQGCFYTLYYKVFDFATIKHLGKLIVGEYSVPPKASLELFGDTVLYLESTARGGSKGGKESKSDKKGEKPKKPKSKDKSKSGGGDASKPESSKSTKSGKKQKAKGKESKVVIVHEDKETQMPEPEEEEADGEDGLVEEPPPPEPGELDWVYVDISLPREFEVIMANLWENAEDIYVTDFKQLFFINRITVNAVIPYVSYVRNHLQKIIEKPDLKQVYLHKFQKVYNSIDEDLREDEELKAELHCRIVEFREKLWQICDERMGDAERERLRIIEENWLTTQLCEVTNNHIGRLQLELDRFSDTMQFITDFYTTCVTKTPTNEHVFEKKSLLRLEIHDTTPAGQNFIKEIEHLLKERYSALDVTHFHHYIAEIYDNHALQFVKHISSLATAALDQTKITLAPTTEGKVKKKAKGKKDKTILWEPAPEIKENAEKLLGEWKSALVGEIARVKLRLHIIKAAAGVDIDDVITCAQKTFHDIYDNIKKRYECEVQSVNTACDLLARAVEAETPLQPQLVLDGDKFYIEPDVILFPEPLILPDVPRERVLNEMFTVPQLNEIFDVFFDAAPSGCINERSLTFFLQDMVTLDAEDGRSSLVPTLWKQLTPSQVSQVVVDLFGNAEYVEWKDFIIYNLSIPFPSEEELMDARKQFREYDPDATEHVKDYQFHNVKFWFEKDMLPELAQEIHQLLFRMYRVDEDTANYTALLLAFSKDSDPEYGVAKALSVCLGKQVCWQNDVGECFIQQILSRRAVDEQNRIEDECKHQANLETAEEGVSQLVDHVVNVCDGVVITDYVSSENALNVAVSTSRSSGLLKTKSLTYTIEDRGDSASTLSSQDYFSNVEIGFEATDSPPKMYFLPFDVLLAVLTAALPWHSRAQNVDGKSLREHVEAIFQSCATAEFNGKVPAHEFLNHADFINFLKRCSKFTAKDPVQIVKGLLGK